MGELGLPSPGGGGGGSESWPHGLSYSRPGGQFGEDILSDSRPQGRETSLRGSGPGTKVVKERDLGLKRGFRNAFREFREFSRVSRISRRGPGVSSERISSQIRGPRAGKLVSVGVVPGPK